MIIVTSILTLMMCQRNGFSWVNRMYVMCFMSNFASLYLSFAQYFEETCYNFSHNLMVSWVIGTAVFFFYWLTIMIYWLFGFKYWVISIHVPHFIGGDPNETTVSSKKFDVIKYTVFAIFTAICLGAAYLRQIISTKMAAVTYNPDPLVLWPITVLYVCMAVACLISAAFLGCALNNLRKTI